MLHRLVFAGLAALAAATALPVTASAQPWDRRGEYRRDERWNGRGEYRRDHGRGYGHEYGRPGYYRPPPPVYYNPPPRPYYPPPGVYIPFR